MEMEEEFLGFVELEGLNARVLAKAIETFVTNLNLDTDKCGGWFLWMFHHVYKGRRYVGDLETKYKKSLLLPLLLLSQA